MESFHIVTSGCEYQLYNSTMGVAQSIKEFTRMTTDAGPVKNGVGLRDKKSSLPVEKAVTAQELRTIYDRLRHTLDLIPPSTSETHPKLFQVRQNILKQIEALSPMILEAVDKELKTSARTAGKK